MERRAGDAADVYECRICGYNAPDVRRLSRHLRAAHPVTSLRDAPEEERGGGACDAATPCVNSGPVKSMPVTPEGSESSSHQTSSHETSSSSQTRDREERKETQNSSPVLPQCPRASGPTQVGHKRPTVCGTSTHNQPNLVCLPLVSEGLKLVWVRSEQMHDLDEVSDLVEAFNAFPYPTPQEAGALARRCAIPPDRVNAWFMMQRVRYGISWGDDDIQETRRKLRRIQRRVTEEVWDEEHERRSLGEIQPSVTEVHVEQRDHTHTPGCTNNNHQHHFQMNPQLLSDSRNLHDAGRQGFIAHEQSPYMIVSDQQPAAQFLLGLRQTLPESFQSFPGKKSKAQLMALRRSFVRKSWPSDVEVQHLQRLTGLSRHEIRKWFADSRYQLRRNGRAWLTKLTKHNIPSQAQQDNNVLPGGSFHSNNEADNAGAQFEVDVDNDEGAVIQSNETKQEISNKREFEDSRHSADHFTSLPLLFPHGRVEPNVRLRKKTREQLEILRQSFLRCQWPTNDDYMILQQKTGLTRTEIIQWFGDTRYHVKHNQIRWMTSQERERIRAVVTQQQKMGGKYARGKSLLEGAGSGLSSGDSAFVNGGGSSEPVTDNEPFREIAPVLPEGKL